MLDDPGSADLSAYVDFPAIRHSAEEVSGLHSLLVIMHNHFPLCHKTNAILWPMENAVIVKYLKLVDQNRCY